MKYLLYLFFLAIIGCSSYTISNESFVSQIKENQDMSRTHTIASVGTGYNANTLTKIKCLDKKGNEVNVHPDKNTTFQITNSQTGKSLTLYYDTVYISGDSIVGLKSRILGGKRSIALADVGSITVKTEN